jgi:hypothetical protein
MAMNIRDQLVYTTVRIETTSTQGCHGSGTGFFMDFCKRGSSRVPSIVTNKHVVAGAIEGRFHMTAKKSEANEPDFGNVIPVPVTEFEKHWILHPDPSVDIAVFPIARLLDRLCEEGKEPFYLAFYNDILGDNSFLINLSAIEDIIMIGYPIGLWDSKHNYPIVRRGITATPPYIDFNGQAQFVIDCACFPGSEPDPKGCCAGAGCVILGFRGIGG